MIAFHCAFPTSFSRLGKIEHLENYLAFFVLMLGKKEKWRQRLDEIYLLSFICGTQRKEQCRL